MQFDKPQEGRILPTGRLEQSSNFRGLHGPPPFAPPGPLPARDRLAAAALSLFNERGYAATAVREIVEAAKVTKPVLYYYFGNKEGLYLHLMEEAYEKFSQTLAASLDHRGSAASRLDHLLTSLFRLFLEHTAEVRLMHALFYGPPQGAPFFDFEKYHHKLQAVVGQILQTGVAGGEFRRLDLQDMTLVVIGVLDIGIELRLCHPELNTSPEDISRMLKVVFTGLKRPRPRSKRSAR